MMRFQGFVRSASEMKKSFFATTLVAYCLGTSIAHGADITIADDGGAQNYGFKQAAQNSQHFKPAEGVGNFPEKDSRGGASVIRMILSTTADNVGNLDAGRASWNGIAWRKNATSPGMPETIQDLDDLVTLGTVEFDYFVESDPNAHPEISFKIWCTNNLQSAIYLAEEITFDTWQTFSRTITPDTVFRGNAKASLTNPVTNNKTLSEIKGEGVNWCSGNAGILEVGIAVGAASKYPQSEQNIYIDQWVLGENTFDFELNGVTQYAPDSPDSLIATPGDTELLIEFDMPEANGSDIVRFEYQISEDGVTFGAATSTGDDEPAFTITGLTNGTDYTVRVRSVNGIGTSDWSDPVTEAPEAGVSPPDAPSELSATVISGDVVISFTAGSDNGATVTDYEAYVEGVGWISTGATESPVTVTGLPDDSTYEIALRGVNSEGNGSISESIEVTIPADTDGDGVPDANDACPNDPTCTSLPVPTLPWPALLTLLSLVGWYGRRRLMS